MCILTYDCYFNILLLLVGSIILTIQLEKFYRYFIVEEHPSRLFSYLLFFDLRHLNTLCNLRPNIQLLIIKNNDSSENSNNNM